MKKIIQNLFFSIILAQADDLPFVIPRDQGLVARGPVRDPALGRLEAIIDRLGNIAAAVLASIAVLFVIYGAFLYLTSQGDPAQIKKARDTIIYALIAIGIALAARVMVEITEFIFRTSVLY